MYKYTYMYIYHDAILYPHTDCVLSFLYFWAITPPPPPPPPPPTHHPPPPPPPPAARTHSPPR